jgi:hypothetical protein
MHGSLEKQPSGPWIQSNAGLPGTDLQAQLAEGIEPSLARPEVEWASYTEALVSQHVHDPKRKVREEAIVHHVLNDEPAGDPAGLGKKGLGVLTVVQHIDKQNGVVAAFGGRNTNAIEVAYRYMGFVRDQDLNALYPDIGSQLHDLIRYAAVSAAYVEYRCTLGNMTRQMTGYHACAPTANVSAVKSTPQP